VSSTAVSCSRLRGDLPRRGGGGFGPPGSETATPLKVCGTRPVGARHARWAMLPGRWPDVGLHSTYEWAPCDRNSRIKNKFEMVSSMGKIFTG
jgi:hypothetical protein